MTVYLLYYEIDEDGAREEWNTFYTPCEAFKDDVRREMRMLELYKQNPNISFHKVEVEISE